MFSIKNKFVKFKKISLVEIDNGLGLKVTLCSYAASIYKVELHGKTITYAPENLSKFMFNGMFYGKTLGRTAGRVKDGKCIIDDKTYLLKTWGKHTLHGAFGLSFRNFSTKLSEDENDEIVTFSYKSKDKDQGYPGNLLVKVIYKISKTINQIKIEYEANSDKDTILNLSNHTYWNLHGDMKKSCLDDVLTINSSKFVDVDEELIFKSIENVNEQTNFKKGMKIGSHINDEYIQKLAKGNDPDFILDTDQGIGPDAVLSTKEINLSIYTTYPIVHLYTANVFEEKYKYHAVALECQKEIFDLSKVILRKDDTYRNSITFRLFRNDEHLY